MRTFVIIIFLLTISRPLAFGQDSMLYKILAPIIPTTLQQKSNLEDSVIQLHADLNKIKNGYADLSTPTASHPKLKPKEEFDLTYSYNYDFYTTLLYQMALNPNPDDHTEQDNLTAYYNITLNAKIKYKKISWTGYVFNEYGYRKYIDSLGNKQEDLYYFKNNFNYDIVKRKLAVSLMTNAKSQFWPTYNYRYNDSLEKEEKYLYADYKSPGYFLFSAGLKWNINEDGANVEIGLAGGKVTRIKNKKIYETRSSDKLYSVPRDKNHIVDFGINIQLNLPPTAITKKLIWENYTQIYLPNKSLWSPKTYTLDVNNALHFMFFKYMRLSLRTKLNYDTQAQEKIKMINQLSIGFYLSNRIS